MINLQRAFEKDVELVHLTPSLDTHNECTSQLETKSSPRPGTREVTNLNP